MGDISVYISLFVSALDVYCFIIQASRMCAQQSAMVFIAGRPYVHVVMRSFSSALDDGLRRRQSLEKFFLAVKAPALSLARRLSRLSCISIDCAKPDVYSSECSLAAHSLIGVSLPLCGDPDIQLYPMRSLRKPVARSTTTKQVLVQQCFKYDTANAGAIHLLRRVSTP